MQNTNIVRIPPTKRYAVTAYSNDLHAIDLLRRLLSPASETGGTWAFEVENQGESSRLVAVTSSSRARPNQFMLLMIGAKLKTIRWMHDQRAALPSPTPSGSPTFTLQLRHNAIKGMQLALAMCPDDALRKHLGDALADFQARELTEPDAYGVWRAVKFGTVYAKPWRLVKTDDTGEEVFAKEGRKRATFATQSIAESWARAHGGLKEGA